MRDRLVEQMEEKQGVTEKLKAENQIHKFKQNARKGTLFLNGVPFSRPFPGSRPQERGRKQV